MKRLWIAIIVLLAIVLAVSTLTDDRLVGDVKSEETRSTSSEKLAKKGIDTPSFQWPDHFQGMYKFDMHNEMTLSTVISKGGKGADGTRDIIADISGVINLNLIEHDEQSFYFGAQISPVAVQYSGRRYELLEKLYQTYFLVLFVSDGTPAQFYFPTSLSLEEKRSLAELVQTFQIQVPPKERIPSSLQWDRDEKNATGIYSARYSMGDGGRIHKSVTGYSKIKMQLEQGSAPSNELYAKILDSRITATLEDKGWLKEVSSFNEMEIHEKGRLWSVSSITASLKSIPLKKDPSLAVWNETRTVKEILQSFALASNELQKMPRGYFEQQRIEALRERWKAVSSDQLVEQAMLMSRDPDVSQNDLISYVHGLRDFLEAYPERAKDIPGIIKKSELGPKATALIMQALELIGHKEAQDALRTVYSDADMNHETRVQALVAASGLTSPEGEMTQGLWGMVGSDLSALDIDASTIVQDSEGNLSDESKTILEKGELASTAILALGALSKTYRDNGDIARANEVNKKIAELLKDATSPEAQAVGLKALENSADISALEDGDKYLESDSSSVRAAAVEAYRYSEKPEDETKVLKIFADDENVKVRSNAFRALKEKNSGQLLDVVVDRTAKEADESLRQNMVRYLADYKESPDVMQVLQNMKEQETSREVMKEVYLAIYSKKKDQKEVNPDEPIMVPAEIGQIGEPGQEITSTVLE